MTNSKHFQSLLKHTNYRVVLISQCQSVTEIIKECMEIVLYEKKYDILQRE